MSKPSDAAIKAALARRWAVRDIDHAKREMSAINGEITKLQARHRELERIVEEAEMKL
jgi:hypothetical protein